MMVRWLLFALALAFGATQPAAAQPAGPTVFRWASDGDANAMDPYTRDETPQLSFLSNIYEGLVRHTRTLEIEPSLAVSWEQTAPTTWRFHLRPNVKWQDGTAFSADDVMFSADRIRSQSSVLKSNLGAVTATRKVDDLTVEFETARPDPIFVQEITTWLIMSKAWCEAHGVTLPANITLGEENYAVRNAMGTGPFRLVSREADRKTVLERNAGWWDTPEHNLDRVEFNVIGNAATRTAALLSGELDMVYAVPPQDAERIARTPGLRLIQGPELRTIFLGMDQSRDVLLKSSVTDRNPFKDVRVRQAFALAIDEDAVAARVMRGQARPTWEMWGPGVNGFDPALNRRPAPDLAHARALLDDAGYPDGFSVGMDCPNDRYVNDEAVCTAVAAMLARIKVKVDLVAQTKSKYFAQIGSPNYTTSLYLLGWTPSTYDAHNVLFALLHTRANGRGLVNDGGFSNSRIDALTDEVAVELDRAKRDALIREAIGIVQSEVAYIPLHQQTISWAARDAVDLVQSPDNYFPLRFVHLK